LTIDTNENINIQNIVMQFLKETILSLESDQSNLLLYNIKWGKKDGEYMWESHTRANLITTALNKLLVGKNESDYIIYNMELINHNVIEKFDK